MRKEGNCYKLSFYVLCSAIVIVCGFIALQSVYGASWDYATKLSKIDLCAVQANTVIVHYNDAPYLLYSDNTYPGTHTEIKKTKKITQVNTDTTLYASTYSDNEIKHRIASATRTALAALQKSKKTIALDEEAMLPHHCSFITLRTMAFKADVGSIYVNAILHKNEYDVDSNWQMLAPIVPMVCISFLCFIAITYCYERFYYRQREAYPQRHSFVVVIFIHSVFVFYTHSGTTYHIIIPHENAQSRYRVKNSDIHIAIVTAVTLRKVFLPVTIAHIKPTLTITTIIPMEAL